MERKTDNTVETEIVALAKIGLKIRTLFGALTESTPNENFPLTVLPSGNWFVRL